MARAQLLAQMARPPRDKTASSRRCLKCREWFKSSWRGHRKCERCNRNPDYDPHYAEGNLRDLSERLKKDKARRRRLGTYSELSDIDRGTE